MANRKNDNRPAEESSNIVIKGGYYIAPATPAKILMHSGSWGTPVSVPDSSSRLKTKYVPVSDKTAPKHSR